MHGRCGPRSWWLLRHYKNLIAMDDSMTRLETEMFGNQVWESGLGICTTWHVSRSPKAWKFHVECIRHVTCSKTISIDCQSLVFATRFWRTWWVTHHNVSSAHTIYIVLTTCICHSNLPCPIWIKHTCTESHGVCHDGNQTNSVMYFSKLN